MKQQHETIIIIRTNAPTSTCAIETGCSLVNKNEETKRKTVPSIPSPSSVRCVNPFNGRTNTPHHTPHSTVRVIHLIPRGISPETGNDGTHLLRGRRISVIQRENAGLAMFAAACSTLCARLLVYRHVRVCQCARGKE